jgi:Tfp pilus assembly protein PilF
MIDAEFQMAAIRSHGRQENSRRIAPRALADQRRAVTMFEEIGDVAGEAEARNRLGETLCAVGEQDNAREQHAAALALAGRIGDRYEQARAHDGLGACARAAGDPRRADDHWRAALARYTDLRVPEADAVRARLDQPLLAANVDPVPPLAAPTCHYGDPSIIGSAAPAG